MIKWEEGHLYCQWTAGELALCRTHSGAEQSSQSWPRPPWGFLKQYPSSPCMNLWVTGHMAWCRQEIIRFPNETEKQWSHSEGGDGDLVSVPPECRWCLLTQSCLTFCNPMDCSPPVSSVRVISQARILEWVVISFSRGSSGPRDWTHVSCIGRQILYHWGTREAPHRNGEE